MTERTTRAWTVAAWAAVCLAVAAIVQFGFVSFELAEPAR